MNTSSLSVANLVTNIFYHLMVIIHTQILMSVRRTLMTVMRMQSVSILMGVTLVHAYQATLEMEGVALVRN